MEPGRRRTAREAGGAIGSRALALAEGALVDVTLMAQTLGFVVPVAVTLALWKDIQAIPERRQGMENAQGRLWDVLTMARLAILKSAGGTSLTYMMTLPVGERSVYTVRLLYGPDETGAPAVTLMPADALEAEEAQIPWMARQTEKSVELGKIVATPGALDALQAAGRTFVDLVSRHVQMDWGELDAQDWLTNDRSLREGGRLLSSYTLPTGIVTWVITEADRSATTLILPSEY